MEKKRKGTVAILALFTVLAVGTTMLLPTEVSAASRPAKVKSLKVASRSYNSLKVSWKKVKNAKGYQIYRATKKNGKYKKVKTIKKAKTVSWTNKKLTTGTRYYYKVRAYKGSRKGSFSTKKSGIPKLSKTSGVKASAASSSAIKVSWNKTSGAIGYQIYRATSKSGSYSKVKTTGSTSFTNTGLAASKTYYYKVRSYRKVGKSTKYSSFSSVVSAKTKPAEPTNPTTPAEPSEPEETNTLKVIERETGKEVTELQAGEIYDVESSSTVYIGTDKSTVGTAASANKAAQICHYARRELHPVSQGVFWLKNEDGVRSYKVIKGTTIQTGGLNIELGGSVPAGSVESYDTIYGYTQYVYNRNTANLVLIGAEDGEVKTVFTMGTYSMNTDEDYLSNAKTTFGAHFLTPVRHFEESIPEEAILSGAELDNMAKEANDVTNAIRVKEGVPTLEIDDAINAEEKTCINRVYEYYGDTNCDSRIHSISDFSGDENAEYGGMGNLPVGIAVVDGYYESSAHKLVMLRESYMKMGAAIIYDGQNYAIGLQGYR